MLTTLPRGITATWRGSVLSGYRARLRVNGEEYSKRFPADATIDEMETWRRHTRADAERGLVVKPEPGTFAADAEEYLTLVTTMPTFNERKRHINLWVEQFGTLRRSQITSRMIEAVVQRWLTVGPRLVQKFVADSVTKRKRRIFESVAAPLSASQVASRMRALENLWTKLDGRRAPNPVRAVREPQAAQGPPRALPLAVIRLVIGLMPDSVAKAWLSVLAWTGTPHATIARMTEACLRLDQPAMWRPGRLKGKGTRGQWVPLTTDGVAAWKLFVRENAWRTKSRQGNMARSWRAAVRRAIAEKRVTDPDLVRALKASRVYDLRHSVGAAIAQAGSWDETMDVLGVTLPTARHYAEAAIDPRIQAAVDRLEQAQRAGESPGEVASEVATEKNPESSS